MAAQSVEELRELLAEIADKAENYLVMVKLNIRLRPEIHIAGLKAGMQEIFDMAKPYREDV